MYKFLVSIHEEKKQKSCTYNIIALYSPLVTKLCRLLLFTALMNGRSNYY